VRVKASCCRGNERHLYKSNGRVGNVWEMWKGGRRLGQVDEGKLQGETSRRVADRHEQHALVDRGMREDFVQRTPPFSPFK
jgi:hypothetical protein